MEPLSEELVHEAARRLGEAARKPARVILFGSYARGDADATSDLDFLVVQKDGFSPRREIVRLQDALSPFRVPAEVLVIDHEEAERPSGRATLYARPSRAASCSMSRPDQARAHGFLERGHADRAAVW